MKSLIIFVSLLALSTIAVAQTPLDDQIALVRQSAQTDRKVIILGNVHFTSAESVDFWPRWEQYRAAMSSNGDMMLAMIKSFAAQYDDMTGPDANKLLESYYTIMREGLDIKEAFTTDIGKFMPAQKVLRIIQIENKLDVAIQMGLAAEIPLAK
jgi:hypothetical protein